MVWNIILPIAAAGIGAVVGAKAQNKRDRGAYEAAQAATQKRQDNYYVNLRNDAEKGGFNPLTALRSGGGMGYSNLAGRITQPLFTRSPLAAGISAGVNQYTSIASQQRLFKHEARMDELNKKLKEAQIKSMTTDMTRNNAFANLGLMDTPNIGSDPANPGQLENRTARLDDKITVNDRIVSGWHPMTLPNDMVVPVPFDPQDSDVGAMIGSTIRVLGIETPLMIGANFKDFVSGVQADIKMQNIYNTVNKDAILRALGTMQNDLAYNMKPKFMPLQNNHFLSLPNLTRDKGIIPENVFSGRGGYMNNPNYSGIFH